MTKATTPRRTFIRRSIRGALLTALAPLLAFAFATPGIAAPPRESGMLADKMELRMISFRATTKNKDIDGSLKAFEKDIKRRGFTGASTLNRGSASVKMKEAATFKMGAGFTATIKPLSEEKGRVTLEVSVKGPGAGSSTKLSFDKGKYQLLSWKLSDGDAVFLAVTGK
ncbi:MAG: hypothetical protein KDA32_08115 [Phycisphaerales bacterium]|nr:hypothetical protein [Phycisphaerales bacterium]